MSKKHTPRKPATLSPVERAIFRKKWADAIADARLQVLDGDGQQAVVDSVAALFLIIGTAMSLDDYEASDELVLASVAAMEVSAGAPLTPARRSTMSDGLAVVEAALPALGVGAVQVATADVSARLKTCGIFWKDFENVFGKR